MLDWSPCALPSQAGDSGWELSHCPGAAGDAGCRCRGSTPGGGSVGRLWGRNQAQLTASLLFPPPVGASVLGAPVPRASVPGTSALEASLPGASVPGALVGVREAAGGGPRRGCRPCCSRPLGEQCSLSTAFFVGGGGVGEQCSPAVPPPPPPRSAVAGSAAAPPAGGGAGPRGTCQAACPHAYRLGGGGGRRETPPPPLPTHPEPSGAGRRREHGRGERGLRPHPPPAEAGADRPTQPRAGPAAPSPGRRASVSGPGRGGGGPVPAAPRSRHWSVSRPSQRRRRQAVAALRVLPLFVPTEPSSAGTTRGRGPGGQADTGAAALAPSFHGTSTQLQHGLPGWVLPQPPWAHGWTALCHGGPTPVARTLRPVAPVVRQTGLCPRASLQAAMPCCTVVATPGSARGSSTRAAVPRSAATPRAGSGSGPCIAFPCRQLSFAPPWQP